MISNATQMGQLIDDLLSYARLTRQPLQTRPLDPTRVVHTSIAGLTAEQAERPITYLFSQDTVARLGGHEFAVLIEDVSPPVLPIDLATRIIREVQKPICIDASEVLLSANVGIVVARPEPPDPESILRDASTALLRSRAHGRGHFEIFDPSMQQRAMHRIELESNLRYAVERGELRV